MEAEFLYVTAVQLSATALSKIIIIHLPVLVEMAAVSLYMMVAQPLSIVLLATTQPLDMEMVEVSTFKETFKEAGQQSASARSLKIPQAEEEVFISSIVAHLSATA